MKAVRALETRLKAWRSFRDVAHATRSLAAAQVLRWNGHVAHAKRHLASVGAIHEAVHEGEPSARPRLPAGCAVLAIGTDLGLCGRLNQLVLEATLAVRAEEEVALFVACGVRLHDLLPDDLPWVEEPGPSSMAAAAELAERVDAEIAEAGLRRRLCVVSTVGVSEGGRPRVETSWGATSGPDGENQSARLSDRSLARFSPPGLARDQAVGLLTHARILHAICEAASAEASVRLARMTRAHESADRRIGEQERELRKARQEGITQEMLEVISQRHLLDLAPAGTPAGTQ